MRGNGSAAHKDLFPPIEPNRSGMLKLDGRHTMYWEESGNFRGIPVLFLHGGPGAGCTPAYRRFFDPSHYRIILFDQRGAGRSTPLAETRDNTLPHLIADIERLREHLGVRRWLLFGGSWGSTLALAYGEAHPERCLGFIMRGIFLGRRWEVDWFLYGMATIFPEAAREFAAAVGAEDRRDLLGAYHRLLSDPDPSVHMPAAKAWSRYESACSTMRGHVMISSALAADRCALSLARIEAHYFVNRMFLEDNQLLARLDRVRHLPATVVQGRYDMICPIVTADELVRAWPGSRLVVVDDAGHSAMEPGTRTELVKATEAARRQLAVTA
jgi:proline iminopeptidase